MDFKKKMKQRLYIAISYIVFGTALALLALITKSENQFLSAFGIALAIMGVLRIFQYRKITRSTDAMRKRELAETDERNRMIAERAKSWAFSFSLMAAGIAVIVLSVLGKHHLAQPLSWGMCGMVLLYWIFFLIARQKY